MQSLLHGRLRAKRLRVVGEDSDSGPADSASAPVGPTEGSRGPWAAGS